MKFCKKSEKLHNQCTNLKELLNVEIPAIKRAIKEDKWYLSQRAGQDVGWKEAEEDFIKNYLMTWAAGFKAAYCGFTCSERDNCNIAIRKYR